MGAIVIGSLSDIGNRPLWKKRSQLTWKAILMAIMWSMWKEKIEELLRKKREKSMEDTINEIKLNIALWNNIDYQHEAVQI